MKYDQYYAHGAFSDCTGDITFSVFNPATEALESVVQASSEKDLAAAIQSAERAYRSWSTTALEVRKAALTRLAAALESRTQQIVDSLAREIGCPVWLGELMQVPMAMKGIQFALEGMDQISWTETIGNGLVERVGAGIVGAITPWNFPLHQIVAKVAPAIAAGCAVVLKPSELAPGAAQQFMLAVHDADIPAGVVNMVWGDAALGEALVKHPSVTHVSFTGSTAVGKRIMVDAATELKRVTLELGGKSAVVILDDADLEAALTAALRMSVVNSGQACVSQSRLIVPQAQMAEVKQRLRQLVDTWKMGDPLDKATRLGPLASKRQFERVSSMVDKAMSEGATLIASGNGQVNAEAGGWFYPPTVLGNVRPDMEIAQEEVFGPVLAVMSYQTDDEALALANATRYGLSGAVWSGSAVRATEFARQMRTGQVVINGAAQNLATPFGGRGESGIGRENGRFGIEDLLEYKSLHGAQQ
ncbi:aldehyde dehydrogenase family protein [Herbaspirillum seropedicae]|uniref:aldehyde dehydrogenase family protein n=1 Tax=Herbaspirillum seropedicae TaxID=964 RepID=UPI00285EFF0D|nr:aldehyde dehydrogenase family protein [Herbaspirillum seropedicae]MDR6397499.1 aldehyde dehydrogenase (NAD+) [Herbaspirillum seropedicae]